MMPMPQFLIRQPWILMWEALPGVPAVMAGLLWRVTSDLGV
jgi:hypothetical protein